MTVYACVLSVLKAQGHIVIPYPYLGKWGGDRHSPVFSRTTLSILRRQWTGMSAINCTLTRCSTRAPVCVCVCVCA